MAKLTYIFGSMGSAKTAQALMQRYNFIENNKNVLFLKSAIDNRDGKDIIKSRVGIEAPVIEYKKKDNIIELLTRDLIRFDYVIVDEIELATKKQIEQLKYIAEELDIPVFAYGLRTDFKTQLFAGTKRLFELADVISQVENICHCGKPAIVNARFEENKIIYEGKQIEIGGNERYTSLCYSCWKNGKLKKGVK